MVEADIKRIHTELTGNVIFIEDFKSVSCTKQLYEFVSCLGQKDNSEFDSEYQIDIKICVSACSDARSDYTLRSNFGRITKFHKMITWRQKGMK